MLKKIIIIENGEEVQCDTLEDVVKALLDENYYNMNNEQKIEIRKVRAMANCLNNKMEVVFNAESNCLDGKFIIKNEITYILSLLTLNQVLLIEKKDSNIFTKSLNKENLKDNYIIVNKFAKELLAKQML